LPQSGVEASYELGGLTLHAGLSGRGRLLALPYGPML